MFITVRLFVDFLLKMKKIKETSVRYGVDKGTIHMSQDYLCRKRNICRTLTYS